MKEKENKAETDSAVSEPLIEVILRKPGVKSCGQYAAEKVYEVTKSEADRLVKAKGFEKVTAQLKKQLMAENNQVSEKEHK